nr:Chain A, Transcriptional regulator nlh2 [Aquifex aeolicus VF5]4G3V_B Chain B, Transcriptional regulator nlh2 [Aquifex aeolicus VF5]
MERLKLKEINVVNEITKILTGDYTFEESLKEVLKVLYSYLGVEHSFIAIREGNTLRIASSYGYFLNKDVAFKKGEGITGKVFQRGIPLVIPNVKHNSAFANKTGIGRLLTEKHALIAAPIKVGGEVKGVITIFKEFSDKESLENFYQTINVIGNLLGMFFKLREKFESEKKA